jgi:hypothetical protein
MENEDWLRVAGACNHLNCLVLPFRLELSGREGYATKRSGAFSRCARANAFAVS